MIKGEKMKKILTAFLAMFFIIFLFGCQKTAEPEKTYNIKYEVTAVEGTGNYVYVCEGEFRVYYYNELGNELSFYTSAGGPGHTALWSKNIIAKPGQYVSLKAEKIKNIPCSSTATNSLTIIIKIFKDDVLWLTSQSTGTLQGVNPVQITGNLPN